MALFSLAERQFIQAHLTDDVRALVLRPNSSGLDIKKLVAQIVARQKAREKLPSWYANEQLIFPPALSVEQASSERTAIYKASLVEGELLLDLTGGMGVDSWAFAQQVKRVEYIEHQPDLAALAAYNLPLLGSPNVVFRVGNGLSLLENTSLQESGFSSLTKPADWIYLDPHRRDEHGGRVVRLENCEPDITQPGIVSALLDKARKILIKASPLLDIDLAVRQLSGSVESVHIVAVQGEVKEILLTLSNQSIEKDKIKFNSVNLSNNSVIPFQFQWYEEQTAAVQLGNPLRYVYEPNAAVLKAGAFRLVAVRFGLTKLAPNSHLYTSNELKPDFPGRVFELREVIKPESKALKIAVPDLKANLTVRNFPQTVAELRKKLSLREGGAAYILATTLLNGDKRLLITKKVDQTIEPH
ncbi:SAM-dependent methyltransferase [Spirosoma sp. HMF3257]|uniref:SAM-dependent methyltransferase n=1 Tax=Spirosoma telluris TaxID=2183553 RepID=A0A327NWE7_9BACT|nr:SAM-dependent methyltransferase [Spirosoma telluris]RAI78356.1 SAM-dependent methyltransferase [Spirosoma telluris]